MASLTRAGQADANVGTSSGDGVAARVPVHRDLVDRTLAGEAGLGQVADPGRPSRHTPHVPATPRAAVSTALSGDLAWVRALHVALAVAGSGAAV